MQSHFFKVIKCYIYSNIEELCEHFDFIRFGSAMQDAYLLEEVT